jgi:hypothetical protein
VLVHSQATKRVHSIRSFAAFDANGKIVHVHTVVTMEGAEETPLAEIEQRALDLAAERGFDRSELATLQLDPAKIEPDVRYRVDPRKRVLQPASRLQA